MGKIEDFPKENSEETTMDLSHKFRANSLSNPYTTRAASKDLSKDLPTHVRRNNEDFTMGSISTQQASKYP